MQQPQCLDDIIGQPVHPMMACLRNDEPRCFLLEGQPGIGKSATAMALANQLGANEDWEGYMLVIAASELTIETCRDIFEHHLRLRRSNWKVLILEELDGVVSKQVERYLKVKLDLNAPSGMRLTNKTCIIATSNDSSRLSEALLERFRRIHYSSGGEFAMSCRKRLKAMWTDMTDEESPPRGWNTWGDCGSRFSMRDALRRLEDAAYMRGLTPV